MAARRRSAAARSPVIPRPLATATGALFGALSRLRGARIFHPRGVGFEATLSVDRPCRGYRNVPLLERPGDHRAIVRLSRAAGLPDFLPDVLGLSLRLQDLHGPGRHQDFLLVTSADVPGLHHLLLPAPRGFMSRSYSSLLLYRVGGRLRLVGAEPALVRPRGDRGTLAEVTEAAAAGALRFRLALASLQGRWNPFADLVIGEQLDGDRTERLAFNPWNSGGGIRPIGPLQGLRRAAYAGSQRGRGERAPESRKPRRSGVSSRSG